MKKTRLSALFLLLVFLMVSVFAVPAAALGDDVDYDYGGWDDGGGWDDDDDWGGGGWTGGNDYGGSSGSGGSSGPGTIAVIVVVAIVFIVLSAFKKSGSGQAPTQTMRHTSGNSDTQRKNPGSLDRLRQADPKFSASDMEAKVKNWVMQFEKAWCDGDMSPCRPFISDGLFHTYQSQLETMKQNGEIARSEDLAVTACTVESWQKDGDNEYLNVFLKEKKRTYKVDRNDPQKVIKGDRGVVYLLEYRWQLIRSAGSVSENAGTRVEECPNCGAQTSVNQSGACEYCGSTLVTESFDWVLNKVDKLSQSSYRSPASPQ